MTESGGGPSFDSLQNQQLEIYAREFRRLYEEERRLRSLLEEKNAAPPPPARSVIVGGKVCPVGQLGRYKIQRKIGQGASAWVFKAYDPVLDRDVALKVLHPYDQDDESFAERFRIEAQATANLSHPNILQVYDFGEDEGFSYLVSKFLTGGTLAIRVGKRHDVGEVLGYLAPLADGLDHAHAAGIIHRDVKPSNVLLDSDGAAVLADFGIARILEGGSTESRLTRQKLVVGTPEYMSPEQVLGKTVDHRSDLYSFGIMLYELVLGILPHQADTPTGTMLAHVQDPVLPPKAIVAGLDARIEAVLLKALHREPDRRYQSGGELIYDLIAATSGSAREAGSLLTQKAAFDGGLPPIAEGSSTIHAPVSDRL